MVLQLLQYACFLWIVIEWKCYMLSFPCLSQLVAFPSVRFARNPVIVHSWVVTLFLSSVDESATCVIPATLCSGWCPRSEEDPGRRCGWCHGGSNSSSLSEQRIYPRWLLCEQWIQKGGTEAWTTDRAYPWRGEPWTVLSASCGIFCCWSTFPKLTWNPVVYAMCETNFLEQNKFWGIVFAICRIMLLL